MFIFITLYDVENLHLSYPTSGLQTSNKFPCKTTPDSLNSKMAELSEAEKLQRKQLEFKNIKEKSKFEINVKII